MSDNRDSFIFYRSFQNAIDEASETDQLIIYRAIAKYALNREEPELKGISKIVWALIRPQLEANWRKYKNGCKGGEFGKMGGAPKGNTNAVKQNNPKTIPNQPQNNPIPVKKTTRNVNDNVNENNNENNNIIFVPTTLEDVKAYIKKNNLNVTPGTFFEYYSGTNWIDKNGAQVKNWKLKAQTWSKQADNKGEYNRVEVLNGVDLGAGEFIVNGIRCYGDRNKPVQIPDSMPPRPSLQYCLDRDNLKWIIL